MSLQKGSLESSENGDRMVEEELQVVNYGAEDDNGVQTRLWKPHLSSDMKRTCHSAVYFPYPSTNLFLRRQGNFPEEEILK